MYLAFKEFCTVGISYEMFENTNDTYYWFCNNSDMYASDLKTDLYEFYIVLKYQEVL